MEDLMIKNCIQKPAKGMKGIILYTFNNKYVFRVYKEDHSFTDYDILHCDLDVTIDSDDATFYEFEDGTNALDHSYEVYNNLLAGEDRNSIVVNEYNIGTEEGFKKFIQSRNKI